MSALRSLDVQDKIQRTRLPAINVELDAAVISPMLAVIGLVALALFGARLAPHEPIYFVVEHGTDPRPYDPGVVFPFGSDVLGRDILSLVLAGAGTTLAIILAGGIARVVAGVALAAIGAAWQPLRLVTESAAELVSSIPATLVALVVVKVLVKADTTILVFVGALLIIGWAGPYRVVRAEIDRLTHAPFTLGARALGVSGWRLFWRHQLPHLVPVLAVNLAQQTVASLVLVAELGVLGTFVGTTRLINIEESLSRVTVGPVNAAQIADPPEWGGLLAGARTVESLWTTRWLIFVPGVAFAVAALAIAIVGFGLAQRYARRDLFDDLRGPGAALFGAALAVLVVASTLVPARYAEARAWAEAARTSMRAATNDVATAFSAAGLTPLGSSFALERVTGGITQTSGSSVTVGGASVSEKWPRDIRATQFGADVRSFVTAETGGGVVAAPLVFAGRGIVPSENPPPVFRTQFGLQSPDLGTLIANYPDDYAGLDVRGKVVLLVRFYGFQHQTYDDRGREKTRLTVNGFGQEDSIAGAIKRGAAGVLFVDPDLPFYADTFIANSLRTIAAPSPYARAERDAPPKTTSGIPVVLLSTTGAAQLTASLGIDISSLYGYEDFGKFAGTASLSRAFDVTARLAVPLQRQETRATSYAGEIAGVPASETHILVWAVQASGSPTASQDVLAGVARSLAPRRVPFIFVSFDPSGDAVANQKQITDALSGRAISLVLVLSDLSGDRLQFTTPYGDLIPALDLYADEAGARHVLTRDTPMVLALGSIAPFPAIRTVVIQGTGVTGDASQDAASLIGYLAGRYAMGAEELRR